MEKHPLKQLKIISEAKSLITHEIDVLYQSDKRKKHFCLDAEQINRILAYVVLESGLTDLIAVIQLIEDFTTSEVQESRLGQALVSLKTAAGMLVGRQFVFCQKKIDTADPNITLKLHHLGLTSENKRRRHVHTFRQPQNKNRLTILDSGGKADRQLTISSMF